jgi:hypothetical protein
MSCGDGLTVGRPGLNPPVGGGANPASPLQFIMRGTPEWIIREVPLREATNFVGKHHYSKVMPKLNKVVFGLFEKDVMVGVITFGWGVRPEDTIKKLFPSLRSKDYLEIGKLCLLDELPKNSESRFISAAMRFLKKLRPELNLVFTWADAIWGKPGYIYQAANFLFGGSISSEAYRTKEGARLHPRQLHKYMVSIDAAHKGDKGRYVTPAEVKKNPELGLYNWAPKESLIKLNASGVRRPYPSDMEHFGLSHVRGLQFRYVYFLCSDKERDGLLNESTVHWHRDYPKSEDCVWQLKTGSEKWHKWEPLKNGGVPFTSAFDIERKPCKKMNRPASN